MKTQSFVKLRQHDKQIIYLIKEELKSRKFFHALGKAGLDDCFFEVNLDSLILYNLGLSEHTDETFRKYDAIMDQRSGKVKANLNSVMKQAHKAYHELLELK